MLLPLPLISFIFMHDMVHTTETSG